MSIAFLLSTQGLLQYSKLCGNLFRLARVRVKKKYKGTSNLIVAVHQPQYLPWIGYFDKMRGRMFFAI